MEPAKAPVELDTKPESPPKDERPDTATELLKPALEWEHLENLDNPWNWPLGLKIFHTFIPSLIGFLVTFGSSIYILGRIDIIEAFHVSTTVSLFPYSFWQLGIVFGPIVAAPLSEQYGRKVVYLASIPIFALFVLGCALSNNMASLTICRFLAALFGSPGMSLGSGTIADVWPAATRAMPMSIFLVSTFVGISIGNVVGGFIVKLSWRWTEWMTLILAGAVFVPTLFMRETYKKTILEKKAAKNRPQSSTEKGRLPKVNLPAITTFIKQIFTTNLLRPIHMMFTEPIVGSFTLYIAFVLAELYSLIATVPFIFSTKYHFDTGRQGLCFLGFTVGFLLAGTTVIFFARYKAAEAKRLKKRPPPEARLQLAQVGGIMLPLASLWLGWSSNYAALWIAPVLGMVFVSMAVFLVFMPCSLYVVDCFGPRYAASAVAATRIAGYAAGFAFPLFTIQMFTNLGIGWACTLLGLIALVLSPIPFVFGRYGPKMRAKTRYGIKPPAPAPAKEAQSKA